METTAVYRHFANTKTASDISSFFARFGPIHRAEDADQSFIPLRNVIVIRTIIKAITKDVEVGKKILILLSNLRRPIGLLSLALVIEGGDPTPKMRIRAQDLDTAMLLQYLLDLERRAQFKRCPQCGEYFDFGPGTKHRSTAIYCSPKCQNAAAYAKRKARKV